MRYFVAIPVLLLVSKTALVYLTVQLVVSVVEAILFHLRAWRGVPPSPGAPLWSGSFIWSIKSDLLANWGANAAAIILLTADKLIASGAAPIAEYGRYLFAASIIGILGSTVGMCAQVYLPLMIRYFTLNEQGNLLDVLRTFSTISAALVVPAATAAIVFGDHILVLLMGNNAGSVSYYWLIFALLAVGGALSAFTRVAHTMQIAAGRPDIAFKFTMGGAVIYPIVLWFVVQQMGLLGAALTWLMFNAVMFLPFFVVTCRLVRGIGPFHWIWRYLIVPSLISVAAFAGARELQAVWTFLLWPGFILAGAVAASIIACLDPTIRADAEMGLAIANRTARTIRG
jgi:O-antigen/teichoic acid export membrane protein